MGNIWEGSEFGSLFQHKFKHFNISEIRHVPVQISIVIQYKFFICGIHEMHMFQ